MCPLKNIVLETNESTLALNWRLVFIKKDWLSLPKVSVGLYQEWNNNEIYIVFWEYFQSVSFLT